MDSKQTDEKKADAKPAKKPGFWSKIGNGAANFIGELLGAYLSNRN